MCRYCLRAHCRRRDAGRINRTGTPGPKLTPADVKPVAANIPLYDGTTVRTLFLSSGCVTAAD
jgi:hypothetical protein